MNYLGMLDVSHAAPVTFHVSAMRKAHRFLRTFLGAVGSLVVSLTSMIASCDETTTRAGEGISWSNVMFQAELERTNPTELRDLSKKWEAQERQLVLNGLRQIPCLAEFNSLFSTNVNFFNFSFEKPQLWTMQTGLYGRYILRMEVLFKVDPTWTNVVSYNPPSVQIITYDNSPPGGRGFCEGREFSRCSFTASDWAKLVAAGGDLAALGFKASTTSPIKNFDVEWRKRQW